MAISRTFNCSCIDCSKEIEAWSDGNPYYINHKGKKEYAYHPSGLLEICIGNDVPHICLDCGRNFRNDTRKPKDKCPMKKCQSSNIKAHYDLDGETCPFCKQGTFIEDPFNFKIS